MIPEWLDPRLDGKKPKGVPGGGEVQVGVPLVAGTWKVDVGREQVLADSARVVGKDLLEFFLILVRHLCQQLSVPVFVASSALGHRVGSRETVEHLCNTVEGWRQWGVIERERAQAAREFLLPVVRDADEGSRDWVLVSVVGPDVERPLSVCACRIELGGARRRLDGR